MKKIFLTTVFLFTCLLCMASNQDYLWPIKGARAGVGIIYQPQDYIGKELVFSNLFIEAAEGTVVVAPTDGVISRISIAYRESLMSSYSYRVSSSIDSKLEELKSDEKLKSNVLKGVNPKFLGGRITIKRGSYNIHITGLTGSKIFKTGQKIKKGTPIGKVGYSYHKILKPSIMISISRNGKSSDPMTPFGLKTSYIPPIKMEPVETLTKQQVKEDFRVYIESLKELFPGLYDVLTKEQLNDYVTKTVAKIDGFESDLRFEDFNNIFQKTLAKIHDSHIYTRGYLWKKEKEKRPEYMPAIMFGFIQDTLICKIVSKGYEKYLKREIKSVNGIPADSIKTIFSSTVHAYDAKVEGYTDAQIGLLSSSDIFSPDMVVEFKDGEKVDFKGIPRNKVYYLQRNRYSSNSGDSRRGKKYEFRILDNSTAYLKISTFVLSEVDLETVASLIDSASTKKHLIIDVRNNSGGHAEAINKIFSHIALDTVRLNGYTMVNKQERFKMLKHSDNLTATSKPFTNYKPIKGKDKFYTTEDTYVSQILIPDSLINFKNKIYVLTNENSISAATTLPALVVKTNRGVIIGRETRSAYHFMNALKFANMRLPNSKFTVTIPLVKIVFDDVVSERVPYGRGVIPDYYVPLTWDEIFTYNNDKILSQALKLIEDEEGVKSIPTAELEESSEDKSRNLYLYLLIGGAVVSLGIIIILKRRRK